MINFYKFYKNSSELYGFNWRLDKIPKIAWDFMWCTNLCDEFHPYLRKTLDKVNIKWLKKRERLWATSAFHSYYYAHNVLHYRFELGEEILSKHPKYAQLYAVYILKDRFELFDKNFLKDDVYCSYGWYLHFLREKNIILEKEIKILQSVYPEIFKCQTQVFFDYFGEK